jgi:hypothetical protein
MAIERSTEGLINAQFDLIDEVASTKELSLKDRIKNTTSLVSGIRQVAALDLQHKKFLAKAPEFAREVTPLQLVSKDDASEATPEAKEA